jgi:hypothetical protein
VHRQVTHTQAGGPRRQLVVAAHKGGGADGEIQLSCDVCRLSIR